MPRLARDPTLPTDRADRRRELARRRQARKREREGTDHVAALARQLRERLTEDERRRLAGLLVARRTR